VAKAGTGPLVASGLLKTVAFIFVSPFLGFLLGSLLMVAVAWICRRTSPMRVDNVFRRLQLVSAGLYSLGHGGNDAQKTIGIIWLLLITAGISTTADARPPAWVIWSCYLAIGPGHAVRWLAHREDHGATHHQAQARGRILCRDRGGDDPVPGHFDGHPGVDHAHHHRRDLRRRLGAKPVGGALGAGRPHRDGLDRHHTGHGLHRGPCSTASGAWSSSAAAPGGVVLSAVFSSHSKNFCTP
jgi:hypothetical protein